MIAAHAAGIRGLRDRRHRRRPSRRPRRARATAAARRSTSRPTSRSSAGRRWRSSAPARRRSSTSRPRSSTSRPAACRSSRSARPTLPGFYARSSGVPAPQRVPDVDAAAAPVGHPSRSRARRRDPRLRPVARRTLALPDDVARDAVERAVARGRRGRHRRARRSRRGCSPGSRAHRWRLGPRQHGADRERRPGRGRDRASGRGGRLQATDGWRAHPSALPGPGTLVTRPTAVDRSTAHLPTEDRPTCASTRAVRARTSRRSSARSAPSSTSAGCARSSSSRRPTGSSSRASSSSGAARRHLVATRWARRSRRR